MNSRRCSEISVLIDLTASHSCRGGGWLNIHDVHPEGSTASCIGLLPCDWLISYLSQCAVEQIQLQLLHTKKKKNQFYEFASVHI